MTNEEIIRNLKCTLVMCKDILDYLEQEPCDKCEVANPCLYCKHEFEPQESEDTVPFDFELYQAGLMEFPETFEKFAKEYGFKDDKEVYTNGSDLIPIFRVKQWLEHDNKLRTIEKDTAYECGKHANKWIPVSERLPENHDDVLVWFEYIKDDYDCAWWGLAYYSQQYKKWVVSTNERNPIVKAWMPLPEPYKAEKE